MSKTFGKKTILINSAYRTNPNSSSTTDFIYTFPETVRNVVHTNLFNAVIENGVYNVVAGVNDTFNMGFINYNTPNITATFNSPGTQTMPPNALGQGMTFTGTTPTGTILYGSSVNICDQNNGVLATAIVLGTPTSTSISVALTSIINAGSVITGFLINQYLPATAYATSVSPNNWVVVGANKTFTIVPGSGVFLPDVNTTNVSVVDNTTGNIVGEASVVSYNAGTQALVLKIQTVDVPTPVTSNWQIIKSAPIPTAGTNYIPVTIPAKYYDLQSLTGIIQDRVNQSIPTTWDLPVGLTKTTFVAKIDSQGYFYLLNNDTPNWIVQFPQPGFQALLGYITLTSSPGVLPLASPNQANAPYEVISPGLMKIANYDLLLIQSDRLGNSITSAQGFDCWWAIPSANSLNNSTTISYENTRHPLLETAWKVPRDFEFIDIRILDKFGKVVDIGNNNIQIVVECFTDDDARK
jgi:hypothetical protein